MTLILVLSGILCLITWILEGFGLWSICTTIATVMFCGRCVGYFCKPKHCVATEIIGAFLTIVFRLLFHKFILWRCLVGLLVRVCFYFIVFWDTTQYVYSQEERRKDVVEDEKW